MANRFSNPSSGLGINRFKVWPNKTTDSYNTADLVANFDKADAMFGIPAAGTAWPPDEGIDGGVYKQVKLLQNDRTPIGTIVSWWRPNGGIAIPTGWVEVKGQTLTGSQHGFAGGGTIVLPDLRNRYIIGADSTTTAGQAWVAVGNVNIDAAAGAPGLGYASGSNQSTLAIANLPAHDHGGGSHIHSVIDGGHTHGVIDSGHNHTGITGGSSAQVWTRGGDSQSAAVNDGSDGFTTAHTHSIPTDNAHVSITSGTANVSVAASAAIVNSQGSGTPVDNRPASVGLIILMKVLYSTTP